MEWTKTSELVAVIRDQFIHQPLEMTYTEWEDDDLDTDETITVLHGSLTEIEMIENRWKGYDLRLGFKTDGQPLGAEIWMDFPPDDEDTIAQMNEPNKLLLLANEATLTLKKEL
ncbi:hypothetical protein BEP19_16420 [Ammoniphilus oxalaticus]|uniref:Uncharacterized protein n=1 Tax=Ammoniphilus oxalaticus TaxID=66863 RepID=A0A419SQK9_9BACL|nr:hypothetical protein [Ammoniphilus oxalaticus]RKD26782.1 hypothetical protein BEP19_16420 [Ammoniphilus oxalaticus]